MTASLSVFAKPVTKFRAGIVRLSAVPAVDRTGGKFGAGLIRGVSLVTVGEALGHGLWLDAEFVQTVHLAALAQQDIGLKSRFTHPDMSGDGLSHFLGRFRDAQLSADGRQVLADLHFAKSAHDTPDGDLAAYLMTRAEEDPASFGMSIVFDRDIGEEDRFAALHEDEDGRFLSPDEANQDHLTHARLAKLWTADAVDDPAANPDGLFHRPLTLAIEATAAYALGLTAERPASTALDVDPDRLRDFASRFLANRGLRLAKADSSDGSDRSDVSDQSDLSDSFAVTQGDPPVSESAPAAPPPETPPVTDDAPVSSPPVAETPPAAAADAGLSELRRYLTLFGDAGGRYLADGLTIEAATAKHLESLQAAIRAEHDRANAAEQQLAELTKRRQATAALEETVPLKTGTGDGKPKAFRDLFRIRRN
jgi:hypothetical protein